MTYNDLASKFYCIYADGAGVICEAPIGLYEELVRLSIKYSRQEADWNVITQHLSEKGFNDHCQEYVAELLGIGTVTFLPGE